METLLLLAIAGTTGAISALIQGLSRRRLSTLGDRVEHALLDPRDDLRACAREVQRRLEDAFLKRLARRRRRNPGHEPSPSERQLRLLRAAVAIERADLNIAMDELSRCRDAPEFPVVQLRLRLARGEQVDGVTIGYVRLDDPPADAALPALVADTRAQLLLASDAHTAVGLARLPATRLRALVSSGDEAGATALLKTLAEPRVDALCRTFPADPATLFVLAQRQANGPYR